MTKYGNSCRHKNNIGPGANWTPTSSSSGAYELNTFQYSHPKAGGLGAVYTQHGMIKAPAPLTDGGPQNHLKVYQRRPFLMGEYYDSGCAPLYCSNGTDNVYPTGRPACSGPQTSSWDNKKLDPYFASGDPYIANGVPTNVVCYKGISANSTAGWVYVTPASGSSRDVPMWTVGPAAAASASKK